MQLWQKQQLDFIKRAERAADKARKKLPADGYCHPPQAKRTKCVCGNVVTLGRLGRREAACSTCSRVHVKAEGSAFASMRDSGNSYQRRAGGKKGCPGVGLATLASEKLTSVKD